MAKMHNISRQTLIHYDQIGLFKPIYTNEKGYRMYSEPQIPFLREICFLKSLGVSLDEIKNSFQERDPKKVVSLLNKRKEEIDTQITQLNKIRTHLQQRINLYECVAEGKYPLDKPFIEFFPQRYILFEAFENYPTRVDLHLTIMKIWRNISNHNLTLANGFGTLVLKEYMRTDKPLQEAGSFIFLPPTHEVEGNVKKIPKGDFACWCRYGMPYESGALVKLLKWVDKQGYEIIGDVVDACLLDTTFYRSDKNVDLCMLQIPIKKK